MIEASFGSLLNLALRILNLFSCSGSRADCERDRDAERAFAEAFLR